jgi:hypothetical protein
MAEVNNFATTTVASSRRFDAPAFIRSVGSGIVTAVDMDDSFDHIGSTYPLRLMEEETGIQLPLEHLYNEEEILKLGFPTKGAFLARFNQAHNRKEYIRQKIRPRHVKALIEAAQKGDYAILTARPPEFADSLLEKLDWNGVLPHLRAGVHHVPSGKTKVDVMRDKGFDRLIDDGPHHIHGVVEYGLEGVGIVGHRPWNQLSDYRAAFGGQIPPGVVLVPNFVAALDPRVAPVADGR